MVTKCSSANNNNNHIFGIDSDLDGRQCEGEIAAIKFLGNIFGLYLDRTWTEGLPDDEHPGNAQQKFYQQWNVPYSHPLDFIAAK